MTPVIGSSRPGAHPLFLRDEALALSVERISKTYSSVHEQRYTPTISLFALLRERRAGDAFVLLPELAGDTDDDEEEDEGPLGPAGEGEESNLSDVSFEVRRGEALWVVADPHPPALTLARVICGMTAPTSGRVVVRGRVAPSVELARALTTQAKTPRAVARELASLVGPGRRRHSAYVEAALDLALGRPWAAAPTTRAPRQILTRVALAAALDPFSEVLVVDRFPGVGEPDFRERCLERVRERLSAGAAVVVTSDDADLVALCGRAIRLQGGTVAPPEVQTEPTEPDHGESSLPEPPAAEKTRPEAKNVRVQPVLRAFNELAAILAATPVDRKGYPVELVRAEEELRVRLDFETAQSAEVTVVVRLVGDATINFVNEKVMLEEGAHVALLRLPAGTIAAGEYDVAVGVVLEQPGLRSKVGRKRAAQVRIDDDADGHALVAQSGMLPPGGGADASAEAEWSIESLPARG
ncbi:MAG: hypothetical protein MSC30_06070 [Gaiellaceae bacterium MAG52_C11]|nr:hypothetical protein [Candidatus Gaiellasilicea maunaloa]